MLLAEEIPTCPDCRDAGFTIEHDVIRNPGKFEGEPLDTYHAYHVMLDGDADDSDESEWRVGNVICHEREDGFVIGRVFDSEADAIRVWEENAPDTPDAEDEGNL